MKEITQASDVSHTPFPLFSLPINFLNLRPQRVWHVLDALRPTSEGFVSPLCGGANRPLHGTKELVIIAINRSLGESMIRQRQCLLRYIRIPYTSLMPVFRRHAPF